MKREKRRGLRIEFWDILILIGLGNGELVKERVNK